MGKDKLRRFAENKTFTNLFQPEFKEVFNGDFSNKGKWHSDIFKNDNPIVLELGCGRGEYTIGMGKENDSRNYIGVDIKGARLWRGAKTATEDAMNHIAFIRTKIEFLASFFAKGEVDEIWITFPDPQLKVKRAKKRLSGSRFLNIYNTLLKSDGTVNLKTDSMELYLYTSALLKHNNIEPEIDTNNLYDSVHAKGNLLIKTHYESKFLEEGKPITYLRFKLPENHVVELPDDVIKELAGEVEA